MVDLKRTASLLGRHPCWPAGSHQKLPVLTWLPWERAHFIPAATNPAHLLEGAEEALGVAARGAGAVDALQQAVGDFGAGLFVALLNAAKGN